LRWIQDLVRADQPFGVDMLGAVGRRIDNNIGFAGVQRAICLVGEPSIAVGEAGLQHDIAGPEGLMIGHGFNSQNCLIYCFFWRGWRPAESRTFHPRRGGHSHAFSAVSTNSNRARSSSEIIVLSKSLGKLMTLRQ